MDTLTEHDLQALDNALVEYEPLPHAIDDALESLYGYDASMELLGRLEEVFSLCAALLPKIKRCTDVEILRKLSCRISTGMLLIAIIEEWHPPSKIYGSDHADHSEMKQDIRKQCRRTRQNISEVFKTIHDRIKWCRSCRNVKVIDQTDPSNPVVLYDSENLPNPEVLKGLVFEEVKIIDQSDPSNPVVLFDTNELGTTSHGLPADHVVPATTQPTNSN